MAREMGNDLGQFSALCTCLMAYWLKASRQWARTSKQLTLQLFRWHCRVKKVDYDIT